MEFSQSQISTMKQLFTEVVKAENEKFYTEIEGLISSITTDTETNKLLALQKVYLRKDVLTMKEVAKAQLLGKKYTTETVLNKLRNLEGCYQEQAGKPYKIITSALIQYREVYGIK